MKLTHCDAIDCDASTQPGSDDWTIYWLQVGYTDGPRFDACTRSCAVAITTQKELGNP